MAAPGHTSGLPNVDVPTVDGSEASRFRRRRTESRTSNTALDVRDLWDDPVGVAALLQQWADAQGAAGGGTGVQLDVRLDGVTK